MHTATARTAACLALTVLAAATLAGCVAARPLPTFVPTADAAAPLFASDEEALAAAEKAYAAYQEMSNHIARDGGMDVERLEPFVTEDYFSVVVEGFQQFQDEGWTGQGGTRFDTAKLQRVEQSDGQTTVTVYLCLDASEARLLNRTGFDVTPTGRRVRTPLLVSLVAHTPSILLIESSKLWPGDNFC